MTTATAKALTGAELDSFIERLTLLHGSHRPDGEMCVMEAAAYIAGEPWSDHPACVSPVIGAFLRSWNDSMDYDDRQMLKPYVARVVGTRGSDIAEMTRSYLALDWLCRVCTPRWLRAAGLDGDANACAALGEVVNARSVQRASATLNMARKNAEAAEAALWAAARAAARAAAEAALRPIVVELQASALDLLDRMIAA